MTHLFFVFRDRLAYIISKLWTGILQCIVFQFWGSSSVLSSPGCMVRITVRHNERDGVSNHRDLDCLLNRLFRRRSKKTLKLRVTGLCEGNSPLTGVFPHKGPVTRKMLPFDDVKVCQNN